MPQEIGAAAAYEAYRQVKYGQNVYSFLYSDFERQREALRALAIAEGVCHHYHFTHRSILMVLFLTPHVIFSCSLSSVARHGPWGRPIWLTGCVRRCGGDSR